MRFSTELTDGQWFHIMTILLFISTIAIVLMIHYITILKETLERTQRWYEVSSKSRSELREALRKEEEKSINAIAMYVMSTQNQLYLNHKEGLNKIEG